MEKKLLRNSIGFFLLFLSVSISLKFQTFAFGKAFVRSLYVQWFCVSVFLFLYLYLCLIFGFNNFCLFLYSIFFSIILNVLFYFQYFGLSLPLLYFCSLSHVLVFSLFDCLSFLSILTCVLVYYLLHSFFNLFSSLIAAYFCLPFFRSLFLSVFFAQFFNSRLLCLLLKAKIAIFRWNKNNRSKWKELTHKELELGKCFIS